MASKGKEIQVTPRKEKQSAQVTNCLKCKAAGIYPNGRCEACSGKEGGNGR